MRHPLTWIVFVALTASQQQEDVLRFVNPLIGTADGGNCPFKNAF